MAAICHSLQSPGDASEDRDVGMVLHLMASPMASLADVAAMASHPSGVPHERGVEWRERIGSLGRIDLGLNKTQRVPPRPAGYP